MPKEKSVQNNAEDAARQLIGDSRHGGRGQAVYDAIKRQIESGDLAPGAPVREQDLCDALQVSRTPVREAFTSLESEGLISHDAKLGRVVTSLDYQAVMELFGLREVLEGTSARLAALHASPAEIDALRGMLRKEETLLPDLRELAVHNRMFHRAIYLASRNRYLIKQLESIQSTGSLLGRTKRTAENRVETSLLEHTAIVEAIANRQEDAAENAMRQHIRETQKARVLRFL